MFGFVVQKWATYIIDRKDEIVAVEFLSRSINLFSSSRHCLLLKKLGVRMGIRNVTSLPMLTPLDVVTILKNREFFSGLHPFAEIHKYQSINLSREVR